MQPLGPLFATPRTATVPYTIGIAPLLPGNMQKVGLLIFSAIFFGIVFFPFCYRSKDY